MNRAQRARVRNDKKKRDKRLLFIDRELRSLIDTYNHKEYVKLNKPIKWGYKKTFKLKEQYKRSSKAKLYLEALKYINIVTYHNTKDCTKAKFPFSFLKETELQCIYPHKYKKLSPELQKLFIKKEKCYFNHRVITYYNFSMPYIFEPHITKHMISKIKQNDPVMDKKIDELKNYIKTHNLNPRINKLRGLPTSGGVKRRFNFADKKSLMDKYTKNILNEYWIE